MEAARETDVAIIGGGPAGSSLAALLARRGAAVTLIDRDAFPRDKLCGEFLSYDALPVIELLGVLAEIDAKGSPRIERCRIVTDRKSVEFAFPCAARGVSRMTLDALLVANAERAGARLVLDTTAEDVSPAGDRFEIRCSRNEERFTVRARVVVGAWGRWGRIDRSLQRPFIQDKEHRHFGFKRHYAMTRPSELIDLYSFNLGYLGVSSIDGNRTNICGLVHDSRITGLKGGWNAFREELQEESDSLRSLYASAVPLNDYISSDPVIFSGKSVVERGIYLAGDASGILDPLTGNGMAMALHSSLLLSLHLPELLAGKSDEAAYVKRHAALFERRVRWSRRAAQILKRPQLLDAALRALPSSRIGRFLLERTRGDLRQIDALVSAYRASVQI